MVRFVRCSLPSNTSSQTTSRSVPDSDFNAGTSSTLVLPLCTSVNVAVKLLWERLTPSHVTAKKSISTPSWGTRQVMIPLLMRQVQWIVSFRQTCFGCSQLSSVTLPSAGIIPAIENKQMLMKKNLVCQHVFYQYMISYMHNYTTCTNELKKDNS